MATWPPYARFIMDGHQVEDEVPVLRTQMENGVARERLLDEESLWRISGTIVIKTKAELLAFEAWRKDEIRKIGWFDFKHPITGATIRARFVAGKVGPIVPLVPNYGLTNRQVTVEFYE